MNRETRRRLKQNNVVKQSTGNGQLSIAEHNRMRLALDEGITLGFNTAANMVEQVAMSVAGVGEKRARMIREAFNENLNRCLTKQKIAKDDAE